jgi:hypothetical protein
LSLEAIIEGAVGIKKCLVGFIHFVENISKHGESYHKEARQNQKITKLQRTL